MLKLELKQLENSTESIMNIESASDFGILIKKIRNAQKLTQPELAGACGVGLRFIVDLEKGKPTCEIEKALLVANMLGIRLIAQDPQSISGADHGG